MAVYEYKGLDSGGAAVTGIVDADTAKGARSRLRKQKIFVTEIHEQSESGTRGSGLNIEIDIEKYFQFVSVKDVATVTNQLSTLVGAHVPIGESLHALVEQAEKDKLKVVLTKVKERVNEGSNLADAMSDHPKVFNDLYIHMVRAGEKSGALGQVLRRLSKFSDSQVKLQNDILAAMAYPILIGFVGVGILMGLFIMVIPKIRGLFEDMLGGEAGLPLLTRAVFLFGDVLVGYWWIVPPILIAAVVGFRRWVGTESGRERWDRIKLRAPVFGKLNRLVAVARFCRTLSTLLMSGVPIITALGIAEKVSGNVIIAAAIQGAASNISEGQSIAAPLKASGEFPPMVTHMVAIGERTGELERMLTVVADTYEEEVEATISAMTSLLGPAMIMAVGGIVFVVALGLLLPMSQLSSMIR